MNILMRNFHGLFDTQDASVGYWKIVEQQRVPHHTVSHSRRLLYRFHNHFHPYAEQLLQELVINDIAGLEALDTRVPELREDFFDATYKPKTTIALRSSADFGSDPAAVLSQSVDLNGSP